MKLSNVKVIKVTTFIIPRNNNVPMQSFHAIIPIKDKSWSMKEHAWRFKMSNKTINWKLMWSKTQTISIKKERLSKVIAVPPQISRRYTVSTSQKQSWNIIRKKMIFWKENYLGLKAWITITKRIPTTPMNHKKTTFALKTKMKTTIQNNKRKSATKTKIKTIN